MHILENGQCGMCAHFGADHANDVAIVQLRRQREASEEMIDTCGHPKHAPLHLRVTPISGCDGFQAAA